MDMQLPGLLGRDPEEPCAAPGTEYLRLAQSRKLLFSLIRQFQRAVAGPGGVIEPICILHAILPPCAAYFGIVESLPDPSPAGRATAQRDRHRHILREIRETLNRCCAPGANPDVADLAHALDALVMHEAAKRLRDSDPIERIAPL